MSTRFKNFQPDIAVMDDVDTVAALVKMLSGMGIERSRIDAMINKTTRPVAEPRSPYKAENLNDAQEKRSLRSLA